MNAKNRQNQPFKISKTEELEFGGILGSYFMVIGLPIAVIFINALCNQASCNLNIITPELHTDFASLCIIFIWLLFHAVIAILPIGKIAYGLPLRDGSRLHYRCNAFIALEMSLMLLLLLLVFEVPISSLHTKFHHLQTAAMIWAILLSIYLYLRSLSAPQNALAEGGNSGNVVYDFFLGRELNPRIGQLDLKFSCELRPGLIGWIVLDLAFIAQAYTSSSGPSPALLLITLFHFWYVADALWYEEAILTTMDIVHDGFGFMLAFGDLVWVPFLYCLQARYALEHPHTWNSISLAIFFSLHVVGYIIFRWSNSQKNDFRKNPNDPKLAYLDTLATSSGKRLLISGWWGLCRHPNYLGDLIMALSWSLPCGFNNIMPYFYPIYFLCLLVHRCLRDEAACKKKYGKDWDKYCSIVKYRIFPYIF